MAETRYTYAIHLFPNGIVDSSRLTLEIQDSTISTSLARIDTDADSCFIWFRAPVSGSERAVLTALVAAHSGEPLPQPVAEVNTLADGTPLVAISRPQSDGLPQVAIAPTTGSETIIVSHNFCDRCTWFGDSSRVIDELLIDHGDGVTFDSAHTHWIDVVSGRLYADSVASDNQKATNPEDPHGYLVVVKVNDIEQTMREPYETSGGDYEVIWETGQIYFFSAPIAAPVVSYSYATTSTYYVHPTPGKTLRILRAEVDVSHDTVMTDTIVYTVYALVDVVAPELVAGNMVPSGTIIPAGEVVYKRMGQITAEAQGCYPPVEILGATPEELMMPIDEFRRKSRGTRSKVQALPFNYSTTRDLFSAAQMEIQVRTKHHRSFEGDTVTVTFYCVSKTEE